MSNLDKWIREPESMGSEALAVLPGLIERFPFCGGYRILHCIALANAHSTRLNAQLESTATYLPEQTKLFQLINRGEYEWISLMLEIEKKKLLDNKVSDNFTLVDQFLDSQSLPIEGDNTPAYDLSALADSLPIDDLFSAPNDGSPAGDGSSDGFDLIDSFLEAEEKGTLFVPQPEKKEEILPDTEPENIREKVFLTESLAKLYCKKGKFEQALAIFSKLNLEYSQKSTYFAEQIRYLEKVIELQKEQRSSEEESIKY